MCWRSHIQQRLWRFLGLKTRPSPICVSPQRGNTSDRKKYQEGKQITKSEGRATSEKKRGGGQKEKRVAAQPTNVWKCNSYFYRSTSLIFWEGEIADSFAVITFTCTLAELFMKDLNRGYVMGKRLFTNNTKSKKALKWTKKCHINLRSCQRMWTQVQRPS